MSEGPRLLLIDGNNLCFREFFSKKNLAFQGHSVDLLYGVFKSLVSYHKKWPDYFRIFAWEGGYSRRLQESELAVKSGLIPSSYKANRRRKSLEPDPKIEALFEQVDILETLLDKTRTMQVRAKGYEADDVLYSYAKWAVRNGGKAVIVSSDQDFYQCLCPNVEVFDARKQELWTHELFQLQFGFPPTLWVDKGAIEGEIGESKDNIFGVDGWGPVNACKYVSMYGDIDCILQALREKEKLTKREEVFLRQEVKLRLAKSLKQMDDIQDLPRPRIVRNIDEGVIKKMFIQYGFSSLLKEVRRFL